VKSLKIAVFAQSKNVLLPYEVLLQNSVDTIESFWIEDNKPVAPRGCDIAVFDIDDLKYIKILRQHLLSAEKENKTVLVSPYSITQIQQQLGTLASIDLILTKPLKFEKLLHYIETTVYLNKKNNLLDKKTRCLCGLSSFFRQISPCTRPRGLSTTLTATF
jgi:hypothetical protein